MLQLILTIILYLIMVVPVGFYVYKRATNKPTLMDPIFDRLDGLIYKVSGIDPEEGMSWKNMLPLF